MTRIAVLTLIAAGACLLLLIPDFQRIERPVRPGFDMQAMTPPDKHQFRGGFESEQASTVDAREPNPMQVESPQIPATGSIETKVVDWILAVYPELARIESLERQPAYAALAELSPLLASNDPVVRLAAIESIGELNLDAALPAVSAALIDPAPQLRIAAIEALAWRDDQSMAGSIELMLHDRNREVRIAAIEAIAELESEASVHALAGLLSDADPIIRQRTVYALADVGGRTAMQYLLQAHYDPSPSIRKAARAILLELEYEATID